MADLLNILLAVVDILLFPLIELREVDERFEAKCPNINFILLVVA